MRMLAGYACSQGAKLNLLNMLRVLVLLIVLCLAACEDPRVPLNPGRARSMADMKLELLGKDWGTAREVAKPDRVDAEGRRFWTVHYPLGPEGQIRVVYVNDATSWAQAHESPTDPVVTNKIEHKPAEVLEHQRFSEGSSILILAAGHPDVLDAEVIRLNSLALQTGLLPQFSVRRLKADNGQLIFGWNNNHGIQENQRILDWVTLRTTYKDAYWLDLLGAD